MCGIFGATILSEKNIDEHLERLRLFSETLFKMSESRGKEASGVSVHTDNRITVFKQPVRGSELIKKNEFKNLFVNTGKESPGYISLIGHSRLATNGAQTDNSNNQPVFDNKGVIIHNGIIVNQDLLWKNVIKSHPRSGVDTEVILSLINYYSLKGNDAEESVKLTFKKLKGSASIAYYPTSLHKMILATNTGSLYFVEHGKNIFLFASEAFILKKFLQIFNFDRVDTSIKHLEAGSGITVDLRSLRVENFSLNKIKRKGKKTKLPDKIFDICEIRSVNSTFLYNRSINNSLPLLRKHYFDHDKIGKLVRCTKCILPATMPGIYFNEEGVCNYCLNFKKIVYKGRRELENIIVKYRTNSKKPDCILAFSGGRDSSYGLHYLKKELGMNPIAYTYDWGMVTDLARRNQARLVGKLGVEHIVVSADISNKRENIRKNIYAWLKKPDLGMIPLFMAGDKQAEYYVDRVSRQTGVKLIIYCSGLEYENDEFKARYSGVTNGYPEGILNKLSFKGRLKIASYYINQFRKNPSYINSSLWDSAFGYFSIYIKPHNYAYLWEYIPWNEDKIVTTIRREYGWETDPNNILTWRTDDGTPAFYNYIYFQVQGFTENDTFRSNQIRNGDINRKKALNLVSQENQPRYEALKWYFDAIGLDGHKVLTAVDNLPRFY